MADAETLNDIIELIVGMVDAAPGADILAELEAAVDAGATVEDVAVAIAANPAWSGDTGLFPDYLPNAIFAEQWITQLMGDQFPDVDGETDPTLQEAIDELTALLNDGTGRGEAMYATIVALSETTDADLADASAALANKTAVASYYSIDVAQSSEDLDDLLGVVDGVDETEASVDAATDAVDDDIAMNAPLANLVENLAAANEAKADYLAAQDIDEDPLTPTTEAAIEAARLAADTAVDGEANVGAGYLGGSAALKAALLGDAAVLFAADLKVFTDALTAAQATVGGTGSVTGLDAAIAAFEATVDASDAAIEASDLADNAADAALADFNTLNGTAITLNANGTTSDGTTIVLSGTSLVLGPGINETDDPGVTDLLSSAQAREVADLVELGAIATANTALDVVENLDQTGARTTQLGVVDGLMTFIDPATAAEPTDAEMAAEQAALDAGVAQLKADIEALAYAGTDAGTLLALTTLTDAAEAAGFINTADNTAIEKAFGDDGIADADFAVATVLDAALAAASTAVDTNNLATGFDAAVTTYTGLGTAYTGGMTTAVALALAPLALAENGAQAAVDAELLAQAIFNATVATEQAMDALQDAIDDLDDDIADAGTAFGDAGFEVPVDLDSAVKAATADDDIFLADGIDSQIISFAGDDILYVGDGYVLNTGDVDDDGDDTVLEVFLDGADVIIETSVFGSNAAMQEIITITLTGVDTDDLVFDSGFLSLG